MKSVIYLFYLGIFSLLITSCSKSQKKFEKEALSLLQEKLTSKNITKDRVKLVEPKTVYLNDSLCIIDVEYIETTNRGADSIHKMEFIYLASNEKKYVGERTYTKTENRIGITPEEYDIQKQGTFYQNLSYDQGIRYLATVSLNQMGNEVGNESKDFLTLPTSTGTGSWVLQRGDKSNYLSLMGGGKFSRPPFKDFSLMAFLTIDSHPYFTFALFEMAKATIANENDYRCIVTDKNGITHDMTLKNHNGLISPLTSDAKENKEMEALLQQEGTIKVVLTKIDTSSSEPSTYEFSLNLTGYSEAKKFLQ